MKVTLTLIHDTDSLLLPFEGTKPIIHRRMTIANNILILDEPGLLNAYLNTTVTTPIHKALLCNSKAPRRKQHYNPNKTNHLNEPLFSTSGSRVKNRKRLNSQAHPAKAPSTQKCACFTQLTKIQYLELIICDSINKTVRS